MEKLKSQNRDITLKKLIKLQSLPRARHLNQNEKGQSNQSNGAKLSILKQRSQINGIKQIYSTLSNAHSSRNSPSSLVKVGQGYYTPSSFSPKRQQKYIPALNISQQAESETKVLDCLQGFSSRTNKTKHNEALFYVNKEKETSFCKEARDIISKLNKTIEKLQIKMYKCSKAIQSLQGQNISLRRRLVEQQSLINVFRQIFEPYKNNLDLIEVSLESIKQRIQNNIMVTDQLKRSNQKQGDQEKLESTIVRQTKLIKKGSNIYQVNESHEEIILTYQSKMNKLNRHIQRLNEENIKLEQQIQISRNHNQLLSQVLKETEKSSQLKQLYLMTSQELYQYKLRYEKACESQRIIQKANYKLLEKIKMLVSLVGYGVVSKIKSEELQQLVNFTQNIAKYPISVALTSELTGVKQIQLDRKQSEIRDKIIKSVQKTSGFQSNQRVIYRPNFMVFFQYTYRQILGQIQQNYNSNVIKSDVFVLMRGIFDSYYINLKSHLSMRSQSVRFPDFVQTFMENFKIKQDIRRIVYSSNLNQLQFQEKELLKIGFLLKIMDPKISQLPQVITARQFLLRETPRDQILYYLMCRNIIHSGAQLLNQINCGDAFVLCRFQLVKPQLIILLQKYDRKIRDTVFSNIDSKKVKKDHKQFIKPAYVCRLLLQLYRKVKLKKQARLKQIFTNVYHFNRLPLMKYVHFRQIINKNFSFLSGSDVCRMYRNTCALFNSQRVKQGQPTVSFFDCFYACCSQEIFLKEAQNWQKQIHSKINGRQKQPQQMRSQMMQLLPQVIYQQGNQQLHVQYMHILQHSYSNLSSRLDVIRFLSKVMIGQSAGNFISGRNKGVGEQQITVAINQLISKCIQWINGNFRERQSNQARMQKASKQLGRCFKQKVYQFYQQLILDINKEVQKAKKMS